MGLLNPTPGEILDRLSILSLKIFYSAKKGIPDTHFRAEEATLQEAMRQWDGGLAEEYCYQLKEEWDALHAKINTERNGLQAVNSLLWDAEDVVRATDETEAFKLARLCKSIASWNDARSRHIRELNKLYVADDGPEKLHGV